MKLTRRISLVGISLFLAIATIACGKKDEPTNANTAKGPDDAAIKSNVATKLNTDLPGHAISIDSKGGIVTLNGDVKAVQDKMKAEQSAKSVTGVTSVTNNLNIKLPPDEEMKQGVEASLNRQGITGITADVKDGVVTLKGDLQRVKLQDAIKAATEANPKPKQVKHELNLK